MNPKFIEFNGKHPAAPKDKRVYYDHPQKNWKSYGASYRFGIVKWDIDDYDHKTGEVRDYIYSGFSGDRSGIQTVTRGSTNIAVAMSRKKK